MEKKRYFKFFLIELTFILIYNFNIIINNSKGMIIFYKILKDKKIFRNSNRSNEKIISYKNLYEFVKKIMLNMTEIIYII